MLSIRDFFTSKNKDIIGMSITEGVCDHCGSQDLIEDKETGEIICAGCGLVVSRINLTRRGYTEEESTTRPPVKISPSERSKMDRLMAIDRRLRADAGDPYVLRVATNEIKRISQTLYLPENVEEYAESIYRCAQKEGLVLRGTITGFAAASVYAACRTQGVSRTLRQVSEASPESVKDVARMYRILISELNLSVERDTPLKHLSRIAGAVGVSHRVERLAMDILLDMMSGGHHTGKNPKGLAASALYVASRELGERRTQKKFSEAAGISSLTLRKRVKGILEAVDVEKLLENFEE